MMLILIAIIFTAVILLLKEEEKKFFNNGICRNCGGELYRGYEDDNDISCHDCHITKRFFLFSPVTLDEQRKNKIRRERVNELRKQRGLDE